MKTFFGRHYAWAMVAAGFIYLMVTWGIIFNANSIFLVPIEGSLSIGREQTMIAITLRGVAMALGAFLAGSLYARFDFMKVWRSAAVLLSVSYGLIAFMQTSAQYYLLSAIHIVCVTVAGFIPVTMLINRWFLAKTGSAMGLALMGSAAGGMLFSLLAGRLIPVVGWRAANLGFAVLMLLVAGGMTFFVFATRPQDRGVRAYGTGTDSEPVARAVVQDPKPLGRIVFLLIVLGIISMNASLNVLMNNTAPHLQAVGMPLEQASLVISVVMFSMGFGKIALGVLYDWAGIRNATLVTAASFLLGYLGLLYYEIPGAVWLSALGTGFGSAFNSLAPPIFARALYGVGQFTRINAFFQAVGAIGAVAAPMIVAFLFARTGNYTAVFQVFLFSVVATLFIWLFALRGTSAGKNK